MILHLNVDFIKSRENSAIGMTELLLINKKKRSECAPWQNSWPCAMLSPQGAVLFHPNSPTCGNCHPTKCSLANTLSCLSPCPCDSVVLTCTFWNYMRCSQIFTVLLRLLPDFYKEEGAAPLKLVLRSLSGEWYDSGVANCVNSWSDWRGLWNNGEPIGAPGNCRF